MKKLTLLIAALVLSFTAHATIINGTPNPGEFGRLRYWVHTVANAGDTIVLADGTYEEKSVIDFTEAGIVVMAAEGAKPVVKTVGQWMVMNIKASTTFEGITFDSESSEDNDMYAFKLSADAEFKNCTFQDYANACILVDENVVVNKLVIEDCVFDGANTTPVAIYARGIIEDCAIEGTEFKNYTEYCIYANDYYGARFDKLTIDKCLFHDCTYSAVYLAKAKDGLEKQSCSDFTLTNSTIYNVGNDPEGDDVPQRAVVEIRKNSSVASEQKVLIDHITMYNFPAPAHCGAFKVDQTNNTTISNCIAMNPDNIYNKWINPFVISAGATISNSVYFNCGYIDNGATQSNLVKADPMFVDAANGNFQLYAESPAIGLGDPRWGVKAGIQPGEGKLKAAVDAAEDGATIVLGDETYEVSTSIEFNKEGLTIVAAEGTKPVIKLVDEGGNSSLKLSATTTFDGITFDGNNITKYPVTSTGTDASQFTFVNCEFKNYTKWAITNEYGSSHVDNVIIDKCLFHDGGSAVYFNSNGYNGQHSCSYFKMTNTTIYNINYDDWGVGVIHVSANGDATGEQNEVEIDHITMYNVSTKEYGAITVRKSSKLSVTNSIIANPASNSNKYAFYIYGGNVTNTLYYNSKVNSEAPTMTTINKDPLFVNAAENNFDLYANSPAVGAGTNGSNLGDPRWNVSDKTIGTGKRVNVTTADVGSLPWIVQNAASNLQPGDTLVLADGQYTLSTIEFIKENLVVMAAENAKPEIISSGEWENLKISANTTFDGITFNGNNVAQYLISIQDSTTMKTKLVLQNCELKNWKLWAISNQYSDNVVVDSLIIDNCLLHDGAEAAIHFNENAPEGKHACNYFKMTNSTIYNVKSTKYAGIVHVSSNTEKTGMQNKVIIDHVTMYNLDGADLGIIAVRKSSDLTISNTIIANPAAGERASYVYGGVAENVVYYNVSQDGDLTYTNCLTSDPLFVDAANNNFKLKGNSPAIGKATDGTNLGDPRWGVEAIVIGEGDNTAALATQGTALVQVNREFIAGNLYTIALPFTLTDVVSIFGQGTIVYEYDKLLEQNGDVVLHFKEVNTISAGKPYLLKPAQNVNGFVVNNVTLSNSAQTLSFTVGTTTTIAMEPVLSVTSGQTTGGKYWLASDTYLYNNPTALPSLRALFTISTSSGIAPRARVALGENVETGLDNNQLPNTNIQKVLENGQLIIIRDGVKYNVQGQVIK